ncbi:MAG: LysM domain-containing protein [Chloroflexota bacterium]|nr:LysM domain-containing protein [Chloroflexota bacterium]
MEGLELHWYNAGMEKIRLVPTPLLLLALVLLSSCVRATPQPDVTPTRTRDGTLRPYPSDTPSGTPLPTDYVSPTPSATITPTATQVYYDVREGDDMYGIAFGYGISPQAIMTANPTINPRMMGPGTSLLIPITPVPGATATATLALTPTATPPYAALQPPDCYHDAVDGLWCFVLLENNQGGALENVSAEVTVKMGEDVRTETAMMPLNLLPAGASLPLVVYLEGPIPEEFSASAEVDFLLPVMPDDQRYLDVELVDQEVTIRDDGSRADISGTANIPEEGSGARYLWINVTALDSDGHVVATRRWEGESALSAGAQAGFNLTLYSLGGAIDRVEILAEAQAALPSDAED